MASPSVSKKRANVIDPSPVERDNKRIHSSSINDEGDETAATIPDVSATSFNTPGTAQPVCATLVRGYGPVWATGRRDLCEAQPHFKSYQGGLHSRDNIALGLYINKYSEPRDILDRNVLITCVGGGRDLKAGNRKHDEPSHLQRIRKSIGLPVSVIIGKEHTKFHDLHFDPLVPQKALFVELGTFRVIDVWKEMVQPQGINAPYPVWKIKLHTIRTDLKPWYWVDTDGLYDTTAKANPTADGIATEQVEDPYQSSVCTDCRKISPKVFANAPWVCLQNCKQFFIVDGKLLSQAGDDGEGLRYAKGFLDKAECSNGEMKDLPDDIHQMFQPLSTSRDENGKIFYGTEKELRGGFTCPTCRCCNSQVFWGRQECKNCGFCQDATPLPYPMVEINEETRASFDKYKKTIELFDGATIGIKDEYVTKFVEPADAMAKLSIIYMIKNQEGKLIGTIVLERPSDTAKLDPCGADKLLDLLQEEGANMEFRRNPVRCPDTVNEMLSRHYQSNWGVQYDFGVKPIPTVSFSKSPEVVLRSLAMLTKVSRRALERSQMLAEKEQCTLVEGSTLMEGYKPYNELLALAYRETDSISWHDDGEDQLTGVISTASLGSPGTMGLRLKGNKESILTLRLHHGDVVTMCDTRLQALTEHHVDAKGKRRYAMTSRTIDIEYYKNPKHAGKLGSSVEEMEASGRIPDRGEAYVYGNIAGNQA